MSQQLPDPSSEPSRSAASDTNIGLPDELIGRAVGSYRLEERLGGGAMASVYRVTQLRNGEQAALKLLLPGADASMRERFRRELVTVSQLDFPNIVRTLDVNTAGNSELAYIAMELVEGESLGQLLERSGQLSMIDSCALLAPIARALAYAHERGIVHRDVKPSNILLRRSTWGAPNAVRIAAIDSPVVPLLSDFGIALVLDAPELTNAGRTIGTPAYMAPEQCADSREIDGRADIYALGAVLLRCLIGRPLFLGSTTQILHAHVYDPVAIPDENMRLLSPLVVEILQLALAKEPDTRYEDASLLADDLAVAAGQRARSVTRKSASSEATATMTSLNATTPATKTSTHVLVPAPALRNESNATKRPVISSATIEVLPEEDPVIPLIPPKPMHTKARRGNVRLADARWRRPENWLSIAITALLAMVAIGTAFMMWPSPTESIPPTATAVVSVPTEPQIAAIISPTTTAPAIVTDTSTSDISATDTSVNPLPTAIETSTQTSSAATTTPDVATPTSTVAAITLAAITLTENTEAATSMPAEAPTLSAIATISPVITVAIDPTLNPTDTLSTALEALDDGEWHTAFEYLGELHRGSPNYSPDSVAQLLGESYLVMAAINNQSQSYPSTINLLQNGRLLLADYPVVDELKLLSDAAESIQRAESATVRNRELENLQQVHLDIASQLALAGDDCQALEHVLAARAAFASDSIENVETEYRESCEANRLVVKQDRFLATLSGELIYSAQAGSAIVKSNIYRIPVTATTTSSLLIANARYPSRQRGGSTIAYYSMKENSAGIYGFDLNRNGDPNERGRAIAQQFAEDGKDSPASWNFGGDRLIFSSIRESDRRARLYLGYSSGSPTTEFLITLATWPSWRPVPPGSAAEWIVYNGTDSGGNNPGLWLLTIEGIQFARVTDNGNDIAPVWTPEGNGIFFMNNSRSGNWDIYSIAINDAPKLEQPVRFASSGGNDVLPTISPDGSAVAFMSDRGGRWQIWIAPIDGGEPIMLANIEGSLPDPAQQSMQWIK